MSDYAIEGEWFKFKVMIEGERRITEVYTSISTEPLMVMVEDASLPTKYVPSDLEDIFRNVLKGEKAEQRKEDNDR